jgi:signal transduction histidine kinase
VGALARGVPTIGFENRYRGKSGEYRWLQWTGSFLKKSRLIYAAARDVTLQKRLEKEIIEAGDLEKERLGRELHDGLCQNLAGIAALGTMLSRKLSAAGDPGAKDAAEIAGLLNETISGTRDLARGLNPVGLPDIGLAAALRALAGSVRALHRISCRFEGDVLFPTLDPALETHLYRIAQEAVSNALTHGQSGHIAISLRFRDGGGRLRIEDDGVGIPEEKLAQEGIGLHTMNYRARLIGASLEVRPIAPHGTAVSCAFSIPSAPSKRRRNARHAG